MAIAPMTRAQTVDSSSALVFGSLHSVGKTGRIALTFVAPP